MKKSDRDAVEEKKKKYPQIGQVTQFAKDKPAKTYMKQLPINVPDPELVATGRKAGKLEMKINRRKIALKKVTAAKRVEIKDLENQRGKLLTTMSTGTREQEIKCGEFPVFDQNAVQIVRLDDMTIVDVRPMVASERQVDLGVKDPIGTEKGGKTTH